MPIRTPSGIGVYLRRIEGKDASYLSSHAAVLRASGVRWAALMVEALDGFSSSSAALERCAEALREHEIEVWTWSFPDPHARDPIAAARLARDRTDRIQARGVLLDIEAAHAGDKVRPPSGTWVKDLIGETASLLRSDLGLGITSYPVPSMHPRMPWSDMTHARAWGSPQTYSTALSPQLCRRAFAEWGKRFDVLVPSVPAYDVSGVRSLNPGAQMREVLDRVVRDPRTRKPRVPGVAVWSDPQIDASERGVLKSFAASIGW